MFMFKYVLKYVNFYLFHHSSDTRICSSTFGENKMYISKKEAKADVITSFMSLLQWFIAVQRWTICG